MSKEIDGAGTALGVRARPVPKRDEPRSSVTDGADSVSRYYLTSRWASVTGCYATVARVPHSRNAEVQVGSQAEAQFAPAADDIASRAMRRYISIGRGMRTPQEDGARSQAGCQFPWVYLRSERINRSWMPSSSRREKKKG